MTAKEALQKQLNPSTKAENVDYVLYNKESPVLYLKVDDMGIASNFVVNEANKHLLPLPIRQKGSVKLGRKQFESWWKGRRIPASRGGIKEVLATLEKDDTLKYTNILDELARRSYGLSLSDQYWLNPEDRLRWKDVNFFDNDFSEDIGKLLSEADCMLGSLMSPDNTTDGIVKKQWKIINGKRSLLKGSSQMLTQPQPFREKLACKMLAVLLSPYGDWVVPYEVIVNESKKYFSVCENFITTDTEYIPFKHVEEYYKKSNQQSMYDFCKSFYKKDYYVLDLMLILDYIILNEDRHMGNFGFIGCAETGKILRPAPIFDSGNSLFYDAFDYSLRDIKSKPFSENFETNISRIDFGWYKEDIKRLHGEIDEIFTTCFTTPFESEDKKSNYLRIMKQRMITLMKK